MRRAVKKSLNKYPMIKAIIGYFLVRLQTMIISVVVGLVVLVYQHHATRDQIWNETGDHFQDLVKIVQEQQAIITELTNSMNLK
jgi:hypothetical protein